MVTSSNLLQAGWFCQAPISVFSIAPETRRHALNSTPLKETTQVEAIVEKTEIGRVDPYGPPLTVPILNEILKRPQTKAQGAVNSRRKRTVMKGVAQGEPKEPGVRTFLWLRFHNDCLCSANSLIVFA